MVKYLTFVCVLMAASMATAQMCQNEAGHNTVCIVNVIGSAVSTGTSVVSWSNLQSSDPGNSIADPASSGSPGVEYTDPGSSSAMAGAADFVRTLVLGSAFLINGMTGGLQKAIYGPGYQALSPAAQQKWNGVAAGLSMMPMAGFDIGGRSVSLDAVPGMEMRIRQMVGSEVPGSNGWNWGELWGKHFVLETLKQAWKSNAVGAEARVVLKEYLYGEKSIQELINGSSALREHMWEIGYKEVAAPIPSERFLNGIHPLYPWTKASYRKNGLVFGKMIGRDAAGNPLD